MRAYRAVDEPQQPAAGLAMPAEGHWMAQTAQAVSVSRRRVYMTGCIAAAQATRSCSWRRLSASLRSASTSLLVFLLEAMAIHTGRDHGAHRAEGGHNGSPSLAPWCAWCAASRSLPLPG
jgi:hypothetical protein